MPLTPAFPIFSTSIQSEPTTKSSRRFPKALCASEVKLFIDDPVWRAFRLVILVLLVITFVSLVALAVWICYDEYVYRCNPHFVTRSPIIDSLRRNRSSSTTTPIPLPATLTPPPGQ